MAEVLLIDFSSLSHPIWHVESSNPNPDATSVKIIERVRALASAHPHTALCLDSPPYLRSALDPTYKANRKAEDRAGLYHQMALALDVLRADGFPVFAAKGYESDDVIASFVASDLLKDYRYATGEQWTDVAGVLIATADKDLSQLVCETVTIYSLTKSERIDVAGVAAKFEGVTPSMMLDFLCLCGDSADNIKGANKIGPKGAAALLKEFGSCDGLFAAFDKGATFTMTPNLRSRLQEFRTRYPLVKSLIQLRTDAPCDFAAVLRPRTAGDVAEFDASADYVYQPGDAECALMPLATEPNGDRVDTETGEVFDSLEDVMPNTHAHVYSETFDEMGLRTCACGVSKHPETDDERDVYRRSLAERTMPNTPPAAVMAMFDERGIIDETPVVANITADTSALEIPVAPVAVNDAGRSTSDARPVESGADVAKRLTDAGHRFTIGDGGKLLVSDAARLSDDDRAAIRMHRDYLLTLAKPEPQAPAVLTLAQVGQPNGTTAMVEYDRQLEPVSLVQADSLSHALHKSKLFSAWGSPEAVLAIILSGREIGLSTMASLRAFDNIQGKPAPKADLLRAQVLKSGKAQYFVCTERTAESATFKTHRKGDPDPVSLTYTLEQAKTAGLYKPNSGWTKNIEDMLVARSGSKLARLVYPDVCHGLISGEEFDNQ